MNKQLIQERLAECRRQENVLNKELAKLDWIIKESLKKKKVIATKISRNMKYRNLLIDKLIDP